ncbi:DUF4134 domain-containing protein [Chryseobacterium sp. 5_R23647]|uniref:DUF4134 domain-containing protein n=1 Tax=Chryseobacterium sp. 5_R23647 TaxID=2258964 RepID=UPI000E2576F1|nr:DUF4134 domain-containing protein [Chryseobacterium sp. 5_R23647]REC39853.1 hypothetical protein DRF69_21320 [Chryseobacterium sp. 5_R23647]
MKKQINNKKVFKILTTIFACGLLFLPDLMYADIVGELNKWNTKAKLAAKAVVGLAAIGGGVYAYFKMQTDDGSAGKKALLSFIGALIFAAVMFTLIDEFMK